MIRKLWIFALLVAAALICTQPYAFAQYGPPASGSSAAIFFTPATVGLVAGLNGQGSTGNGGLATAAKLNYPVGIAYDSSGNLFLADAQNYVVRRIDHITGDISIFAGTGTFGNSLVGGVATSVSIGEVAGLVIDTSNNVYVSDRSNNVVWKITSGGTISVYAGGGSSGLGDGGAATSAELNNPWALGIDASNNIYISDSYHNIVRVVNQSTNVITTFAGDIADATGCSSGGLYSTSTPPYTPTQAHLCFPEGVAFDSSGDAYIVDASTAVVRVVNKSTGYISIFAGGGTQASSVNGIPATSAIIAPSGVFVDPGNRVYIASSNYVRVVDSSGNINTVFGTGSGSLSSASLGEPSTESINVNIGDADGIYGMAMDPYGNLITASSSGMTILTAGTTGQYVFPQTQIFTTETTTQQNAFSSFYPPYITVSNPSGVTLNFTAAPVVTGPFAVVTGTGAGTCVFPTGSVAPGQSCTIVVSFTPTLGGSPGTVQTGTVILASNANSSPSTILLSGTGTGTATVSATLTTSPLIFTSPAGVTSAAQNATLTNTGQLPIAVGSTDFNGFSPTDFAVSTTTCPSGAATLAVGASCTYSITFTPPAATTYQAGFQACVSTSSYGCLQSITLEGTGTAGATATLLPTPLAFGSVTVAQTSAALSATLSNTSSTTAMTISSFTIGGTNPGDFAVGTGTNACGSTLAANSSCIVYVTFTPASAAGFSAQLSVADSATGSPQTVALTGTGTAAAAPIATLNPIQLSYPNTNIGSSSAAQTFTITDTGTGPLSLTSIALGGTTPSDFTTFNNCGATLAAGDFCTVSVTFTPGFPRLSLASVLVTDNATGSPQSVVITGTGVAATPQATLSGPVTFAATNVGSSAPTQVISLANPGNATLTITSIVISGTNASSFSTTTCGTTLAASATCLITIGFTPTAAGPLMATLTVTDNATAGLTQTAALNGTGTAASAPQATLSPTLLGFPSTTVGVAATSLPVTLSNPGTAALAITSIGVTSGSGFGQTNNCGSSVAAGGSCTITVSFTPSAPGALGATLSVIDNATGSPQTVAITGTGTAALTPQATLTPTTLTFPSTTVGVAATSLPITLSNPGTAALAISNILVGGANASSFGQTNTCSASLAAGASCTITVSFTPGAPGALAASLSVVDNATGSPQSVAIGGTGAAVLVPQATLAPTSLTFASTTVGLAAATQPITLSNPGTGALTITGISVTGANASSFGQTNNCGSSLAAGATCTVTVSFTPGAAGALAAAISVADNASGSPQSVAIAGTGVAGTATFTVSTSTPSVSVQPGGVAQFNLVIAPVGGVYTNVVTLSATGLPAGAQASFLPPSVTPGAAGAPSVLSIQTATGLARLAAPERRGQSPVPLLALLAGLPLLGFAGASRKLRKSTARWMLLGLAALAVLPLLALSGCGGGYFGPAPQTYTVTVTGTSGVLQQTTTVSLTVQ